MKYQRIEDFKRFLYNQLMEDISQMDVLKVGMEFFIEMGDKEEALGNNEKADFYNQEACNIINSEEWKIKGALLKRSFEVISKMAGFYSDWGDVVSELYYENKLFVYRENEKFAGKISDYTDHEYFWKHLECVLDLYDEHGSEMDFDYIG